MSESDKADKSTDTNAKHHPQCRQTSGRARETGPLTGDVDYVPHPSFPLPSAEQRLWGPDRSEIRVAPYRLVPACPEGAPERPSRRLVLTAEEEKTLFLRYNYAKYRLSRLVGSVPKGSRRRHRQETLWRRRARQTRVKIVHANLPLVPAMAKRSRVAGVEFADLISEGQMAVLRCIERFDVSRGFKFSSYACRAILAAFGRLARKERRYGQLVPVHWEPGMEQADEGRYRHAQKLASVIAGVREVVLHNHADLSDVETTVLLGRFPVGSEAAGLTLKQVGRRVGLSNERVRQIEHQGLSKVRQALQEHPAA